MAIEDSDTGGSRRDGRVGGSAGRAVGAVFDGLEALLYGGMALFILVSLVIIGVRAAHRSAGPVGSGVVIFGLVLVLVMVVRDAYRRRWSPVSIGVLLSFIVCVLAVVALDLFTV